MQITNAVQSTLEGEGERWKGLKESERKGGMKQGTSKASLRLERRGGGFVFTTVWCCVAL